MITEEEEASFCAVFILASIAAQSQKPIDDILRAKLYLVFQYKPETEAAIRNSLILSRAFSEILYKWLDLVELIAIEKLKELAELFDNEKSLERFHQILHVINLLGKVGLNRKHLSTEAIRQLLRWWGTGDQDVELILPQLDLSNALVLIKSKNLHEGLLNQVLSTTPLKAIVESQVFTPAETGWIIAARLISRQVALCFDEQEKKLSFFEDGKLQEIFLNPDQVVELLPAIRKAVSSQIGIDLEKLDQ